MTFGLIEHSHIKQLCYDSEDFLHSCSDKNDEGTGELNYGRRIRNRG